MADDTSFDPLECQIESAILNGQEHEARAFLARLTSRQLEEVVKAQRLPGAKGLLQTIEMAGAAGAIDEIMASAAAKVRSRLAAARD